MPQQPVNKGSNGEQPKMRGPSMFNNFPTEMGNIGMNMNAGSHQQQAPQVQAPQQQQTQFPQQNFPPAQTGKSRPEKSAFSKGSKKESDELKEILTGLQLDDAEANAIATDLEDIIGTDSDSEVRQVQFKDSKKKSTIKLA